MTPVTQSLVFQTEPAGVAAAGVFVLLVLILAVLGWWRSGRRPAIAGLEALRVLIAIAIAVTLCQPEWRELYKPEATPVLAVLHDTSASMQTVDVAEEGDLVSRREAVAPLTEASTWQEVEDRMEVVVEPFSSSEDPPEQGTDLHAPLQSVFERFPNLAAVVMVTDGDRTTGDPPGAAATRLRMKGVPILGVPVGSDARLPDVEVTSFDVPAFAVAGKPLRIPYTVESALPQEETITVALEVAESGETVTQTVRLPAMGRVQDAILFRPLDPGDLQLSLSVAPLEEEGNVKNNRMEAPLEVRKERLRVLVIESFPRWEYRYLRNALERDPGVEVNVVLFHPGLGKVGAGQGYLAQLPSETELSEYDVVFVGDVGLAQDQLSNADAELLHRLVRDQATGLVFLPGLRGHQATLWETPLAELLPVVWDAGQPRGYGSATPGRFVLSEAGRGSLLTKLEDSDEESARVWETLPGFQWYAPVVRAKVGSEVLATHGTESNRFGRIPLIVTKTFGSGKILFMGADGAWRWRRGVEDRYHYRFWGQVVRWMAYQRNMARGEKLRLFYSPDRPKTGSSVTLNANVMTLTGEPLRDGVVALQVVSPRGQVTSLRLNAAGEEAWGLFSGTFTPEEGGDYQLKLSSVDAGEELQATLSVQGTSLEPVGRPARPEVLAELVQLTRGDLIRSIDPAEVLKAVRQLPEPEPIERRILLWCHPAWVGLLILLLGGFWIGRKATGSF